MYRNNAEVKSNSRVWNKITQVLENMFSLAKTGQFKNTEILYLSKIFYDVIEWRDLWFESDARVLQSEVLFGGYLQHWSQSN